MGSKLTFRISDLRSRNPPIYSHPKTVRTGDSCPIGWEFGNSELSIGQIFTSEKPLPR
jgi:hypothetical protein